MPEDKLKGIYDFWDSEGYELGGYDNFQQKITAQRTENQSLISFQEKDMI